MNTLIPPSKLTLPFAGRDHIQGPENAEFTLLEYGDYECLYCAQAHEIVKVIQKRLKERLCYVFRNFPAANAHPHAQRAAEAAEAAGAQGKFWEMHVLLFEHQDALEDGHLAQYASALGLDAQRLLSDLASGAHAERVKDDFRSGARGGVNGTPTFFINGERYDGDLDADELLSTMVD